MNLHQAVSGCNAVAGNQDSVALLPSARPATGGGTVLGPVCNYNRVQQYKSAFLYSVYTASILSFLRPAFTIASLSLRLPLRLRFLALLSFFRRLSFFSTCELYSIALVAPVHVRQTTSIEDRYVQKSSRTCCQSYSVQGKSQREIR